VDDEAWFSDGIEGAVFARVPVGIRNHLERCTEGGLEKPPMPCQRPYNGGDRRLFYALVPLNHTLEITEVL
jgi:hypothetical protein